MKEQQSEKMQKMKKMQKIKTAENIKFRQKFHDQLNEHLKKVGLRQTKHRSLLLDLIISEESHFDVTQLAERAKVKNSSMGVATVYRNVLVLKEAGLLLENQFGTNKNMYELVGLKEEHHDHLICNQCGEIIEFYDENIEKNQIVLVEQLGFSLTHHKMELYGNCKQFPKCVNSNSSKSTGTVSRSQ